MTEIEKTYKDLVPIITKMMLGKKLDKSIPYHNISEGYGFYLETKNNCYIDVNVGFQELYVSLYKHNSKYAHDIINDIKIDNTVCKDINQIEGIIEDYLKKAEEQEEIEDAEQFKDFLNINIKNYKTIYKNEPDEAIMKALRQITIGQLALLKLAKLATK